MAVVAACPNSKPREQCPDTAAVVGCVVEDAFAVADGDDELVVLVAFVDAVGRAHPCQLDDASVDDTCCY